MPDNGTAVPTGARASNPLPSAPKDPLHVQPTVGPTSINLPASSVYTPRFPCCASDGGTLTETDPGSEVVVVGAPVDVWQTTTGSDAVTIGPSDARSAIPSPPCSDVVEPAAVVVVDVAGGVVDVVVCFGWVVPDDEPVPDDPHAAISSAPAAATHPTATIRIRPAGASGAAYASAVRSTSRSAKRRCASARRVGMCSVGTSCGS